MSKKSHPTAQKVATLIRARYPIIGVQSSEETRVLANLEKVAEHLGMEFFEWSISEGILDSDGEPAGPNDPVDAIHWLLNGQDMAPSEGSPQGTAAVLVMKDLHPYLTGEQADAVVARSLRDAAAKLVERHQSIILLSPTVDVPADLQKDVTVVDFPFPTEEELEAQVEKFIANLPESVEVDLNGDRTAVVSALKGLTAGEADACLAQAVIENGALDVEAIPYILEQKRQVINQAPDVTYEHRADMAHVGGLDLLKGFFAMAGKVATPEGRAFGAEPVHAVLIVGVQGCGKSLIAKAAASEMNRPLLRQDFGALFGSLVGESQERARNTLAVVDAIGDCVYWWDEIEKGLAPDAGAGGSHQTERQVFATFLTWMEERKHREDAAGTALVIATANDITALKAEFVRRFDAVFFVDFPTAPEREQIFKIHLSKRGRDPQGFDLDTLVKATDQFTGSEIEGVVVEAIRSAFVEGAEAVTTGHLIDTVEQAVPLAQTKADQIAQMRQWAKTARPASSQQESGIQSAKKGRALMMD